MTLTYGHLVIIKKNGDDGSKFPMTNLECTIGKSVECSIRIHRDSIAEKQCLITVEKHGMITLLNLEKSNPIYVNGEEVTSALLKSGDSFRIMDRKLRWEAKNISVKSEISINSAKRRTETLNRLNDISLNKGSCMKRRTIYSLGKHHSVDNNIVYLKSNQDESGAALITSDMENNSMQASWKENKMLSERRLSKRLSKNVKQNISYTKLDKSTNSGINLDDLMNNSSNSRNIEEKSLGASILCENNINTPQRASHNKSSILTEPRMTKLRKSKRLSMPFVDDILSVNSNQENILNNFSNNKSVTPKKEIESQDINLTIEIFKTPVSVARKLNLKKISLSEESVRLKWHRECHSFQTTSTPNIISPTPNKTLDRSYECHRSSRSARILNLIKSNSPNESNTKIENLNMESDVDLKNYTNNEHSFKRTLRSSSNTLTTDYDFDNMKTPILSISNLVSPKSSIKKKEINKLNSSVDVTRKCTSFINKIPTKSISKRSTRSCTPKRVSFMNNLVSNLNKTDLEINKLVTPVKKFKTKHLSIRSSKKQEFDTFYSEASLDITNSSAINENALNASTVRSKRLSEDMKNSRRLEFIDVNKLEEDTLSESCIENKKNMNDSDKHNYSLRHNRSVSSNKNVTIEQNESFKRCNMLINKKQLKLDFSYINNEIADSDILYKSAEFVDINDVNNDSKLEPTSPANNITFSNNTLRNTSRLSKKLTSLLSDKNSFMDTSNVNDLSKENKMQKSILNKLQVCDISDYNNITKTDHVNDVKSVSDTDSLTVVIKKLKSPKNDLRDVKGIKRLLSTPKTVKSPKNDLSNVYGIRKLLSTPKSPKKTSNDLTDVAGVKKIMATPKFKKSPKNDLSDVKGVKQLMSSPNKQQISPKNDLTDVRGIKKLLSSPMKVLKSPKNDLSDVRGVKKIMSSPTKPSKSPKNDLTDVRGVRKIMSSPTKSLKSPKNDLTDVCGVKKLMSSTKKLKSPKNDLSDLRGVKRIFAISKKQKSPKNDLTNLSGIENWLSLPEEKTKPMLIDTSKEYMLRKSQEVNVVETNNSKDVSNTNVLAMKQHSWLNTNSDKIFGTPNIKTYARVKSLSPKKVKIFESPKVLTRSSLNLSSKSKVEEWIKKQQFDKTVEISKNYTRENTTNNVEIKSPLDENTSSQVDSDKKLKTTRKRKCVDIRNENIEIKHGRTLRNRRVMGKSLKEDIENSDKELQKDVDEQNIEPDIKKKLRTRAKQIGKSVESIKVSHEESEKNKENVPTAIKIRKRKLLNQNNSSIDEQVNVSIDVPKTPSGPLRKTRSRKNLPYLDDIDRDSSEITVEKVKKTSVTRNGVNTQVVEKKVRVTRKTAAKHLNTDDDLSLKENTNDNPKTKVKKVKFKDEHKNDVKTEDLCEKEYSNPTENERESSYSPPKTRSRRAQKSSVNDEHTVPVTTTRSTRRCK